MSYYTIPHFLIQPLRTPLLAIAIPVVLGTLSGVPTSKVVKGSWYKALYEPPFTPPRLAFPIVWPLLYSAMGYTSHLAVKIHDTSLSPRTKSLAYRGLQLYWAQLALNFAWTGLFFGAKKKLVALADIASLTGLTYAMTIDLHEATHGATTWFLAPYCAWLTYATYLNTGYWYLNRNRTDLKKLE
ncbi:hypothetical protein FRB94_008132 [Tulasnella sp. JGI-2019a]|nr:hypothetical protein FRB94_008132 [Tulasnella sp. JGI-2019a]KAG9017315.1 hypothetical protein FRB93_007429 [Tulasnella sp. JGI-2019a]KAG9026462.1 hypothetical protein FRB95_008834 [Tulasnella sp. JGI-2019a]